MTLFAVLAALVLEHWRPERPGQPRRTAREWLAWLLDNLNAGGEQHGLLAWTLGALLPALIVAGLGHLLAGIWAPLGWAFDVLALYFCLGFKGASYLAAGVVRSLEQDDLERAREKLGVWRPNLLLGADASSLLRQTLEETFRQALARLFGVLFWFLLLGPAGAVLHVLTHLARDSWHGESAFGDFARRMAAWLDWLPARAMAFSFAIAGNFQDALECWRGQTTEWGDPSDGVLLAAGAGALGLRLGGNLQLSAGALVRPDLGLGEAPGLDALDGVVALVWRAALLWVAVLGLLWLGSL
ncbi:MAG: cobalamin biosynthesis protein [Pseudomonadota bacterium]